MSGTINVFYSLNILQFLSAAGLIGLLAMPFFFPTILYGLPRFQESALIPVARGKVKLPDTGKEESLKVLEARVENRYEADYLLVMERRIESCMMELKPYLQADCNMVYLSKLVDIPLHHLAYYFREEKRQPFNDYRNEWRIVHAKELIMEGKANELTLEAIGLLSGFSTRNTFFTAFKKAEGISPGVFAAQFAK
jgi:AraC-like DNA-binding protein